jgi:hypothetical protein
MRTILLAGAALLALTTPLLAADFGGQYVVKGTNLDGSPYAGTANITITSDTTCEIVWNTGSTSSYGLCMGMGDVISAGYVLGDSVGLVMYQLNDDGSLEGYWTIGGRNGNGTEVLTPVR